MKPLDLSQANAINKSISAHPADVPDGLFQLTSFDAKPLSLTRKGSGYLAVCQNVSGVAFTVGIQSLDEVFEFDELELLSPAQPVKRERTVSTDAIFNLLFIFITFQKSIYSFTS